MIFYFAVGPDESYNSILSGEGVESRLSSFYYLAGRKDEAFDTFIKTGVFKVKRQQKRKLKRVILNASNGLFEDS